jgi:beta-glucanase (GH16 family)
MLSACGKKNNGPGTPDLPKLNFVDVEEAEGTGGTRMLEVKLTLDHAYAEQVSVKYSTIEGTAKAGTDFTAATDQTISFLPNETEKKILINIVTDDIREASEKFQVRLSSPSKLILLKETGNITLNNDDTKVFFNNTGYDAPASYAGYTLSWSDEFNGTALDASAWSSETGDGCPGLCGWGNNELQYYLAPPNNLFFQDGKMMIELKPESYGGKNYTSSRIKTQGKKTFKFGRIDIRAILPKGNGVWPALWMLPQNNVYGGWPTSGEIDIMEMKGGEPSRVLSTMHYGPGPNSTYISRSYSLTGTTFNDEFHVFSIEWKLDQIKCLVDNNLFSTINKADLGANTYPFNEQFYFLVNLAIGGNFPGAPDASTVLPQWMIVDYIRVYQ